MKTIFLKRGIKGALSVALVFAMLMAFAVPSLAATNISSVSLNTARNVLTLYLSQSATQVSGVDLASKIYLKRGNEQFSSLPFGSSAVLDGSKVTVTLTSPLTEEENYVMIKSGAFEGQNVDMNYSRTIDASGPELASNAVSVSADRRTVTIEFDCAIKSANATGNMQNGEILIDRGGNGYFNETVPSNSITVNSSSIKINLTSTLSGSSTRIKICAGAIEKKSNGNVNIQDLVTEKINAEVVVPQIDQTAKVGLTAEGDQVTLTFNTSIKYASTTVANEIRRNIFISREGGNYYPLDNNDVITISGNKMTIKFYYPISGNNNRIKILANAIASLSGDVATSELYSPWINMADLAYNAPTYSSVSYNKGTKQVQIKFNANINAVSNYALANGVLISRNRGEFTSLSKYDTVEIIYSNTIAITLEEGLSGDYNRFRVTGGTIKGNDGNVQTVNQTTDYVDMSMESYEDFEYEIAMNEDMTVADIIFDRYIQSNYAYDDDLDYLKQEIAVMRSGSGLSSYSELTAYDSISISGRTLRIRFQRALGETDIIRINKYALKDSYGAIMKSNIITGPSYGENKSVFDPDSGVELSADKRTVTFNFLEKVYSNMASLSALRYMIRVSYNGENFEELSDDCRIEFISEGVFSITFDKTLTNPEAMIKILPGALQDADGNTINEEIVTNPLGQTDASVQTILGGKKLMLGDETISNDVNGNKIYTVTINSTKLASNLATYAGTKTFEVKLPDYAYGGKMRINGSALQQLLNKGFTITVTCAENSQVFNADNSGLEEALKGLGLESSGAQSVVLEVSISRVEAPYTTNFETKARQKTFTILTQPTEMSVTYSYGTKNYAVTKYDDYAVRKFKIKPSNAQNRNVTVVRIEPSGKVNPVPTKIFSNGQGGYYLEAKVKNSGVYGVISAERFFTDTPSWAENAVNTLASRMVLQNTNAGAFRANEPITRAEVSEMITRALGVLTDRSGSSKFLDVALTDWYFPSTSIANEADIIRGYEDSTFRPERNITRQEAMAIMSRVMKYLGNTDNSNMTTAEAESILSRFKDDNKVAHWAKIDMAKCVDAGVVKGDDKGNLNPLSNLTRAEMSQLVYNLLVEYSLIANY